MHRGGGRSPQRFPRWGYRAPVAGLADSEDDVVAGLVARDEDLFEALVRSWSPVMLRVARVYVDSTEVAEEVVQETWIAVVQQIGSFERGASLRTWVLRICANTGRRHATREKRSNALGVSPDQPTVNPDRFRPDGELWPGHWEPARAPTSWGPEALMLGNESRGVLGDAVRRLPERQSTVVALRDIHGLGTGEIARLMDTTEGNVRVLLHRGRAALRESLADYFTRTEAYG